jgi:hypothetical protein
VTDHSAYVLQDTLDVLQDVLRWELSPARWAGIVAILDAMAADPADQDVIAEGTTQLELAGPVRITRIGATPTQPPPPPVRERVNELIHQLSSKSQADS